MWTALEFRVELSLGLAFPCVCLSATPKSEHVLSSLNSPGLNNSSPLICLENILLTPGGCLPYDSVSEFPEGAWVLTGGFERVEVKLVPPTTGLKEVSVGSEPIGGLVRNGGSSFPDLSMWRRSLAYSLRSLLQEGERWRLPVSGLLGEHNN